MPLPERFHPGAGSAPALCVAAIPPGNGSRGRFGELCGRLDWGQRCVEAGAFPPDILKRAAG